MWATILDAVLVIFAILGGLVTLGTIAYWIRTRLRKTKSGQEREGYKIAARLVANVPIDHFNEALGPPRRRRRIGALDEFTYVNRFFFVQAVVDEDGTVLRYAVTIREAEFNPLLWPNEREPRNNPWISEQRLGEFTLTNSVFESEGEDYLAPDGIWATLGANRWEWVETFYIGRPGNYRHYFVALNDAGWMQDPLPPVAQALPSYTAEVGLFTESGWDREGVDAFIKQPHVAAFRSIAKPNTYGATAPHKWVGPKELPGSWFGVDADQISRLPEDQS